MDSAKRPKLTDSEQQESPFLQILDDNCILQIFKYLDIKNLCQMGHTSQRLRRLGKDYFVLQYPVEAIKLERFERRECNLLNYWKFKNYIQCFGDYKMLILDSKSLNGQKAVLKLINAQSNKPVENRIKKICFEYWGDTRPKNFDLFRELAEVRSIMISNTTKANSFYDSILQYWPAMHDLMIRGESHCTNNDWLTKKYPKLKHLSLHTTNEFKWTDVQQLFEQNPNITVSLHSQNAENINRFMENGVRIIELHYQIKREAKSALNFLIKICAKSKSTRLHLLFSGEGRISLSDNIELLMDLKEKISGLYFDDDKDIDEKTATCIRKIEMLEVIQVPIGPNSESLVNLPQLKKVYMVRGMVRDTTTSTRYIALLLKFAGQCKTLQNLVFQDNINSLQDLSSLFESLNDWRKTLDGAERLKVLIDTKLDYDIELKFDAIDVSRIESVNVDPLVKDIYKHVQRVTKAKQ